MCVGVSPTRVCNTLGIIVRQGGLVSICDSVISLLLLFWLVVGLLRRVRL